MNILLGIFFSFLTFMLFVSGFFMGGFLMAVSHDNPSKDEKAMKFKRQGTFIGILVGSIGLIGAYYTYTWACHFFSL